MNKSDNSVKHAKAAPLSEPPLGTTPPDAVNNTALRELRDATNNLLAACDPVVLIHVKHYLETPAEPDRWLLDAWEKIGRRDAGRRTSVDLRAAAARTLTPLGIACLVRYARAWSDELEAQLWAVSAARRSSSPPPDGGRKSRTEGPPRKPPVRGSESHNRRKPAKPKRAKRA